MPGAGPRKKCPGGTARLPVFEEEEAGPFSNAPCRETECSVRTTEEDGNAKEGGNERDENTARRWRKAESSSSSFPRRCGDSGSQGRATSR
ncbi:hypothetical protein NDU88_006083 [Pleurodeles waltl]|uniref:Uncharacterized protein n=1 Tax=Pleurodeles waltl TaxID=8319 RepID=A0AAV7RNJ9_PLEWA|nr:hypothetical protein NDU88_006083 [Pleurodeles waltl]